MNKFSSKQKVIAGIIIIGSILVFLFLKAFTNKSNFAPSPVKQATTQISPTDKASLTLRDKPQIVSTKPDPLNENVISATEVIEITFNRSLENVGELKIKIEPEIVFKIELSGDRKTGKIIPVKPYQLGTTYTLTIGTETKFDGIGRWGEEKSFHFKTIKYTGV